MRYAVGYLRYSCNEQDDNSIEVQTRAIKEYAEKNGYYLVGIISDKAETGRDDDRENFIKLFKDLRAGKIKAEVILMYRMNRFFRNVLLWGLYEDRLEQIGVKCISIAEPLPDNKPLAQMQKTMIRAFDQFTSDNIGALSLDGTKQIVRKGYWSGGPAPLGYKNAKIPNREGYTRKGEIVMRGTLVRDEPFASIIIRAFEIQAETGKGGSLIYKQLAHEFGKLILGRNGKPLGAKGINAILKNPIYKGTVIYNNYGYKTVLSNLAIDGGKAKVKRYLKDEKEWVVQQNEEWRLVSDELWAAAQAAREKNRQYRPGFGCGNKRASYALTSLLICGVCGKACGGKWQKSRNETFSESSKYFYYRCRGSMNGSEECSNKSKTRGEVLESAVINRLLADLLDEQFIIDVAKEMIAMRQANAAQADDRPELERRRGEVFVELERQVELAGKVGSSIDALARKIRDLEMERMQLDQRLASIQSPGDTPSIDDLRPLVKKKLAKARELLTGSLDVDDLRIALRHWIEAIRMDGDGQVFIKWKSAAAFELLELPPVSEMASEGTRLRHFGYGLAALGEWHLLLGDAIGDMGSGALKKAA